MRAVDLEKDQSGSRRSRGRISCSPAPGSRAPAGSFAVGRISTFTSWIWPNPRSRPGSSGRHDSYVTGLALAGTTLISGSYDGSLKWWDIQSRSLIRTVAAHQKFVRSVAVTPDERLAVSTADDMVCRVWGTSRRGRLIFELRGHEERTPTHFSLDVIHVRPSRATAANLATGDKVGHIVVWGPGDGRQAGCARRNRPMYTWDPVQRHHSIGGIRSLAFFTRRVLSSRSAAAARFRTSTILMVRHSSRFYDWRQAKRTHVFASDQFKGTRREPAVFIPGEAGCSPRGGDRQGGLSELSRPRGQQGAGSGKGTDVRSRRGAERGCRNSLRRRPTTRSPS